ncbi:MAG: MFS transporter [Halothiobacillus sp.]
MQDVSPSFSDDTPPKKRGLILLALCLAVLVAQIDTTVVNLAVHTIGMYFLADMDGLQWVLDSYNLTYAALLLTGGLLADLYGRKLIFMAGAVVFSAASLFSASAPTLILLIEGRMLAGVGAALILPASLAIIRVVWVVPAERHRVLGIWAACNGLALIIGPILGGVLVTQFGWRSIFWVVIPLSIAALVLAVFFIPESLVKAHRRFDLSGQIFGALMLAGIVFAAISLQRAPLVAVLAFFIAMLALAVFVYVESGHGEAALVPLDLFRVREFSGAMVATAGMTFGMYGALFLLPLTWQSIGRFDAIDAGFALMPMALIFMLISPLSGELVKKVGARLPSSGGVLVIGAGLMLIGLNTDEASLFPMEIGLALTGLGMGLATGPLMGLAIGAVASHRAGTASALINVARMTGATLGVALLGAVFSMVHVASSGLQLALLFGGFIQLVGAVILWWVTTPAMGR